VETGVIIYACSMLGVSFLAMLYLLHWSLNLMTEIESQSREEQKYLVELLNSERPGYSIYKVQETAQVKAAATATQLPVGLDTANNTPIEYVNMYEQDIIE